MGEVIRFTCRKCNSIAEVTTGSGKMHHKIKYILPYFDIYRQEEISSILKEDDSLFNFILKEGYCDQCKSIIAIPVFEWKDQVKYGSCPACGESLSKEAVEEIFCRKCGGREFIRERMGLWD